MRARLEKDYRKRFGWFVEKKTKYHKDQYEVNYGVALYTGGPLITNVNSIYLNYLTLPISKRENTELINDMLATVYFPQESYVHWLYLIIDSEEGKLKYVGSRTDNKHPTLYVKKIGGNRYSDQDDNELQIFIGDWHEGEFEPR